MNYIQKSRKDHCPTCKQEIFEYQVCNTLTNAESTPFNFQEVLAKETEKGPSGGSSTNLDEHGSTFECLDHHYFVTEVTKLLQIRNEVELDRFHRRISNKDPSK